MPQDRVAGGEDLCGEEKAGDGECKQAKSLHGKLRFLPRHPKLSTHTSRFKRTGIGLPKWIVCLHEGPRLPDGI